MSSSRGSDSVLGFRIWRRGSAAKGLFSASIAACGMLEMTKYLKKEEADYYTGIAKKLIKSIADGYAVKDVEQSNGLVLHSTYSNHSPYNTCNHYGVDECNIWGDYIIQMHSPYRYISNWGVIENHGLFEIGIAVPDKEKREKYI